MLLSLTRARGAALGLACFTCLVLAPVSRAANALPSDAEQEVLVRTTLLTFNDANLTGNYSVLAERAAKPFRDQVPAERMKEAFKVFQNGAVDLSQCATGKLTQSAPSKIEDDVLILVGKVQMTSSYAAEYTLKYAKMDGKWLLLGINVKTV